mgnify:FL=1
MKITKTHLTQLIKEEIARSIEEAKGAKGITYFPFIGGKLKKDDIGGAKEMISDYRRQYESDKKKKVMSNRESNKILDVLIDMEEIIGRMSKRHKKWEYDADKKRWEHNVKVADRALAHNARKFERSKRNPDDFKAKDWSPPKQDEYSSSLFDEPKREREPETGFTRAGTNMGYGESLDRTKISKSKLAQIIKEELENLLK